MRGFISAKWIYGEDELRAADRLGSKHGIAITQINAPGNNSSGNYKLLREIGATHVEPGHALLGTTPSHAFVDNLPETPSYVYVTEVSHLDEDEAHVFGGGFWVGARLAGNMASALVGRDYEACIANEVRSLNRDDTIIDYYGSLESRGRCRIGDSAIYGFYSQLQMTRSYVAVVSGIRGERPVLEGLFDPGGNLLDDGGCPVGVETIKERIESLMKSYRASPDREPEPD